MRAADGAVEKWNFVVVLVRRERISSPQVVCPPRGVLTEDERLIHIRAAFPTSVYVALLGLASPSCPDPSQTRIYHWILTPPQVSCPDALVASGRERPRLAL